MASPFVELWGHYYRDLFVDIIVLPLQTTFDLLAIFDRHVFPHHISSQFQIYSSHVYILFNACSLQDNVYLKGVNKYIAELLKCTMHGIIYSKIMQLFWMKLFIYLCISLYYSARNHVNQWVLLMHMHCKSQNIISTQNIFHWNMLERLSIRFVWANSHMNLTTQLAL